MLQTGQLLIPRTPANKQQAVRCAARGGVEGFLKGTVDSVFRKYLVLFD